MWTDSVESTWKPKSSLFWSGLPSAGPRAGLPWPGLAWAELMRRTDLTAAFSAAQNRVWSGASTVFKDGFGELFEYSVRAGQRQALFPGKAH